MLGKGETGEEGDGEVLETVEGAERVARDPKVVAGGAAGGAGAGVDTP